ncbi:TetR/AcrR family transcriptional regulator [Granulicoccus phenolivorans]|uniref:TetR/AcrR family transcriptional regulator n=1 Tax=Granulicoccus phenolivorans TaxID=266854 RepID=UPI000422372D|nr:TetR/AcrR family transcriptional regulator [Granulicoccus phenolivorans]
MRSTHSFTHLARREQIISATIRTVAEHGLRDSSLARIAERIEVSKGSILYHFTSRDDLVAAALEQVYGRIAAHMGAALAAATSARDAISRYVTALIGYLDEHREEVRLMFEAFLAQSQNADDSARRWQVLTDLLSAAVSETGSTKVPDPEVLAIALSGAIDSLVGRALTDPTYDLIRAGDDLAGMVDHLLSP